MNNYRALAVALVFATGVLAILGSAPATMPTIPAHNSGATPPFTRVYQPVDFKKWASGMYADEFFGKAVVVDGHVMKSPAYGSIQSSITFYVREKSLDQVRRLARTSHIEATNEIMQFVTISAPLSMRDTVFQLSDDQRVRVYGVVVNPYARSALTGQVTMSALQVQADRIEVVR